MKQTIIILTHFNDAVKPNYAPYVHNHAMALSKLGYNVIVLVSIPIKSNTIFKSFSTEVINGVKIVYFKRLGFSNFLYKSKINLNAISYYLGCKNIIEKIFKENNVVAIDAHTFKTEGVVASKLKRKYNTSTFVTLHGTSFERNLHFKNGICSIRKVASSVDYMICVSEKLEKKLLDLGINNTKVIYNGANQYDYSRDNNNFNIITVGYFTRVKNFDIVIRAFAKVIKRFPMAKLTIIGDGVLSNELKTLVYDLKVENFVKFTGVLDNRGVNRLLSKSNIFVLPSSPEGFGIAYVEAMNNGCIVIGTKNEGIDGFVKNGVNGFLTNVDVNEISDRIIDIFNNKYDDIRDKGYKDARILTWENNAKKYIELFGECYEKW